MNTKTFLQIVTLIIILGGIIGGAIIYNGERERAAIRKELAKPIPQVEMNFDNMELPPFKPHHSEFGHPQPKVELLFKAFWPEVFTNPNFEYDPNEKDVKRKAAVHGLMFWANLMMGEPRPAHTELGLEKIGNFLQIDPTPDNLLNYNRKLKEEEEGDLV